jgi:hypothetical protein
MKMDYSQLSIYKPNSGYSPAELEGTGDPDGTQVPVKFLHEKKTIFISSLLLYIY